MSPWSESGNITEPIRFTLIVNALLPRFDVFSLRAKPVSCFSSAESEVKVMNEIQPF